MKIKFHNFAQAFIFFCIQILSFAYTDQENQLLLELNVGTVVIQLLPDVAPQHVKQIKTLVEQGAYDGIIFHRVIDGFVAQTGDVEFGKYGQVNESKIGTGNSQLPNIPSEFNPIPHKRGAVSMARSQDPNSANSQFFICLENIPFLDGQYSVFGQVIQGMGIVDKIKKGHPQSGKVDNPSYIIKASLK